MLIAGSSKPMISEMMLTTTSISIKVNARDLACVAVDLPSGLEGDTGAVVLRPGGDGSRLAGGGEKEPRKHVCGDSDPAHQPEQHEGDADERDVHAKAVRDPAGDAGDQAVVPAPA